MIQKSVAPTANLYTRPHHSKKNPKLADLNAHRSLEKFPVHIQHRWTDDQACLSDFLARRSGTQDAVPPS